MPTRAGMEGGAQACHESIAAPAVLTEAASGGSERSTAFSIGPRVRSVLAANPPPDVADLLNALVAAGPPPRRQPPAPPAVERVWLPSTALVSNGPAAEIVRRHPELRSGALAHLPETRVKRVTRSMFRGRLGRFHSRKMGRTMRARSDLEFDLFLDCEADPDVEGFLEQPVVLCYEFDGRIRAHTPDLLVRRRTGHEDLIEVKPEAIASKPENESRWRAIGPAVARLGYGYLVLTERQIRRQPRFKNLNTLFRDRHAPLPSDGARAVLVEALGASGSLRIEDLVARFPDLRRKQVHRLILRGCLEADLDAPLTPQSAVRLGRRMHRG